MKTSLLLAATAVIAWPALASAETGVHIGFDSGIVALALPQIAPNMTIATTGTMPDLTPDAIAVGIREGAGFRLDFGALSLFGSGYFLRADSFTTLPIAPGGTSALVMSGLWADPGSSVAAVTSTSPSISAVGSGNMTAVPANSGAVVYATVGTIGQFATCYLGGSSTCTNGAVAMDPAGTTTFAATATPDGIRMAMSGDIEGLTVTFDDRIHGWGGQTALGFRITGPRGGFVGPVLGYLADGSERVLETTTSFDFLFPNTPIAVSTDLGLHETLTSRAQGPVLGVTAEVPVGRRTVIDLTGRYVPLSVDATYAGYEQSTFTHLVDEVPIVVVGVPLSDSASRRGTLLSLDGAAHIAVSDRMTLSLGGQVEYRNAVPTIVRTAIGAAIVAPNGAVASSDGAVDGVPHSPLAALGFASSLSYGFNLGLTFALGGR